MKLIILTVGNCHKFVNLQKNKNKSNMSKLAIKISVAAGLFFLISILMIIFLRAGGTNLIGNDVRIQWIVEVVGVSFAVIILMFLPKNIKSYSTKKKWLIGITTSVIFMVLFFVFFILSAIFFSYVTK